MRVSPDSWEGAIVRGRDRRKGRVQADHRPRFTWGTTSVLVVHWDDHEVTTVAREHVTMLKPPIGFQSVLGTPVTVASAQDRREKIAARWALILGIVAIATFLTAAVLAVLGLI